MEDTTKTQTGGVIMHDQSSPPPPPPPEPVFSPTASVEPPVTVVVPPISSSRPTGAQPGVQPSEVAAMPENPFIPAGAVGEASPPVSVPVGGGGKGPWLRRILIIIVSLLLLGGLVFGIRFFWGILGGSKEVTLTYWGLWEQDTIMTALIREFESKHPRIKVAYIKQSPRQYRERLQAAIGRGEGPDIFRFHNTWVPMLVKELAPVPKSVMSPSEFANTFYPVASEDLVSGSTIYGIPLMIDGLGLYYNEDLFASAGKSPPKTWEDVLSIVPQLTVRNENVIITSAIALGTTNNVEHFSDILAVMLLQNGVNLQQPVGAEAEEALTFYGKFSNPSDPLYTWNETLDNSIYAFSTGRVAMIFAPSWRALDIAQMNPNLHFKIVPIPQLPGNTVTWASYWVEGVSVQTKHEKEAWEFVTYLTGKDAAANLYAEAGKTRLFGEPYARVALGSSLTPDPYVGAYITQAQSAKSFPLASRTFDNGINDKLIKYLEDALNGYLRGSSATEVLDTAANGFRQVLETYGLQSASLPPKTR